MPELVPIDFDVNRDSESLRVNFWLPRRWQESPGIKGFALYIDSDRDAGTGKRFWGDIGADLACHFRFYSPDHPGNRAWVLNDENREIASGTADIRDGQLELTYPVALKSPFNFVLMVINRSEADPTIQANWFAPESAADRRTGHLVSN